MIELPLNKMRPYVMGWAADYQSQFAVNVKDFGGLGDGVSDDTDAISDAIAELPSTGGKIIFPKGTYLSDPFAVEKSGVWLAGSGFGQTRIYNRSTSDDMITIGSVSAAALNCKITDMAIRSPAVRSAGIGINVLNGYNVVLNDVDVRDHFMGVQLGAGSFRYLDRVRVMHDGFTPASGCVGIKVSGGNDDYISNAYITTGQYSNNPLSGLQISDTAGIWLHNIDIVQFGDGMLINPGTGESVSWLWATNVASDTNYRHGMYITVSGSGTIKGLNFTNCWTASNGKTDATTGWGAGMGVYTLGAAIDGVSFNQHRSLKNGREGFYLSGGINIDVLNSFISGNSQQTHGSKNGITIGANVNKFKLIANTVGPLAGQDDYQGTGIYVNSGSSDDYIIALNNLLGNTTSLTDLGSGTNKVIEHNLVNP